MPVRSALHLIHDRGLGDSAPRRGGDVSDHVTVEPAQARRGAIIPVRVTKGKPCPACATRTDETAAQSCATCEGEGRLIRWQHTHRVRLPSGIEDGQKIRLRERGTPGTHGGAPGDLYVTVHVTN